MKHRRKQAFQKHKRHRILILTGLVLATILLVYPSLADSLADYRQILLISGYEDDYQNLSADHMSALKKTALFYNETIWKSQQSRLFHYEGEIYDDPFYDAVLKPAEDSSVMAYIEIPVTGAYLPIVHGTKAEDLAYHAGHMHGTSVPVGGKNTHSVISAHTGMRNAALFDGIDKLTEGDAVYIHVLNETRKYTVRESNVVLPAHTDSFLQIEEGQDLITLYTCTPYGINSHRLLVKCEFTEAVDAQPEQVGRGQMESRTWLALLKCFLWGLLPLAVLVFGLVYLRRTKEERKK